MAVDFDQFRSYAITSLMARFPVMMRGPHGIGKSAVAYEIAAEMGKLLGHENYPVVEARISQKTEGDVSGIPVVNGKYTMFLPPWFLHEAIEKPVTLFLDEVDRGIPEVRQAIMELTDSRKIDGRYLHPDTVIIAATNSGEGHNKYQTGELDAAENDRWAIWDVKMSLPVWLRWASANVHPVICDFIAKNPDHLIYDTKASFVQGKVYPSPRSWDRFSKAVLTTAHMTGGFAKDADPSWLFGLAMGYVGEEAAIAFRDFFTNYDHQIEVSEILVEGKFHLCEDWDINQQGAFCKRMMEEGWWKVDGAVYKDDKVRVNGTTFLMDYVEPELFVKVFQEIIKEQQSNLEVHSASEVKSMGVAVLSTAKNSKGEELFKYFVKLLGTSGE